jgi:SAM-dependent methyltransferase
MTAQNCPFCDSPKNKTLDFGLLKCLNCGLGFSERRYADDDISFSTSENSTEVWRDAQALINKEGLAHLEKLLGKKGRLLDIGCGHGFFVKLAAENGWDAEGVDVSEEAIRHAKDIFKLKIYDQPLAKLDLPKNSYDAVTIWRTIDQLSDPRAELRNIMRILRPGGIVYIRIYNFLFQYHASRLGKTWLFRKLELKPGILHRYGITAGSLRLVLSLTGYGDIHIWNSKATSGDPYATGGKAGRLFVVFVKNAHYLFGQFVRAITFGRLLIASSLMACARKPLNQ